MAFRWFSDSRLERWLLRQPLTIYGPLCFIYGLLISWCAERIFL